MKKILTVGVFDYFHLGHLRLFEQAKELGDYLIVAVQDSEYIKKYKPEADIMYSTKHRVDMVRALKVVDEVVIYTDVDKIVKVIDFDVFALGEDQNHCGFISAMRWCKNNKKEVVRLKRTLGICSSDIKAELKR